MNSFLIQCKVRKAELLQFLGITAVGYLIGLIVVFIVMNVAKENTCATAGTGKAAGTGANPRAGAIIRT